MVKSLIVALSYILFLLPFTAKAADFNEYILRSVKYLYDNHKGGGYDIRKAFTHDLSYDGGIIKASQAPYTMCVAAVQEVIVTAINLYHKDHPAENVVKKIPLKAWTGGNITSLRANIFMYQGTRSAGTGHTLKKFMIGEERTFATLKAGDFINFNRSKTGHATVFINYLHADGTRDGRYDADVKGFTYFSAQGKGKPDAGFAYRDAYFVGSCPQAKKYPVDCGIIRSNNPVLLNTGRMWPPAKWAYEKGVRSVAESTRALILEDEPLTRGDDVLLRSRLNDVLNEEHSMDSSTEALFDGSW